MTNNPAGFWIRLIASFIDGILLTVVLGFLGLIFYNEFIVQGFTFLDILDLLYFILLPIFWYGYTIGKKTVSIRIVRIDGENVGLGTMLLREVVGSLVYGLTLGIGIIVSAFMVGLREDKRSIHDFIAGTYVTYDDPSFQE